MAGKRRTRDKISVAPTYRLYPDVYRSHLELYGKPSGFAIESGKAWKPLRNKAIELFRKKFDHEEYTYLIRLLSPRKLLEDKDYIERDVFLYTLTQETEILDNPDGVDLNNLFSKLQTLHPLEFFFVIKTCVEYKYWKKLGKSIDEYIKYNFR